MSISNSIIYCGINTFIKLLLWNIFPIAPCQHMHFEHCVGGNSRWLIFSENQTFNFGIERLSQIFHLKTKIKIHLKIKRIIKQARSAPLYCTILKYDFRSIWPIIFKEKLF